MYRERSLGWAAQLWAVSGGGSEVVAADGCVDLIWWDSELVLSGPTTRALQPSGAGRAVGLRFRPGVAGILLRAPLSEVANTCVPLSDAVAGLPANAVARVGDDPLAGLEQLLSLLHVEADAGRPRTRDLALRAELLRLADAGTSAERVSDRLGLSSRQTRREMQRLFGYSYRTLGGIRRAQRAAGALRGGATPAQVAADHGFSDQPHLTREIGRFFGRTPAQLVRAA